MTPTKVPQLFRQIVLLIFGLIPGAPNLVPLLLINVAVISGAVFALRGIYFALLEQGGIPVAITGTAAGLVSVIGYTPDIFVPPLAGMILDAYPGAEGYQRFFLVISGLSFIDQSGGVLTNQDMS